MIIFKERCFDLKSLRIFLVFTRLNFRVLHRESSMKQYVKPASADSTALQLRQSPFASVL
jgi:hypothetical protein